MPDRVADDEMAGPPSIRATSSGNWSIVPIAACASGRVTRANTPTGVSRRTAGSKQAGAHRRRRASCPCRRRPSSWCP